ncbi:MAG: prepilin-type N-terminal cleavage/methylation domain-containing protein [Armatimonadetes bacterium]|nr:prepilin-type N-terminal cleavage/methylation domain-containing protein [Armatimonadota bacterium]
MNKRGFTLVEMLVVVAVIVLLSAILVPTFTQTIEKSMETSCQSNLKQIATAIMMYAQDYDETLPLAVGAPIDSSPACGGCKAFSPFRMTGGGQLLQWFQACGWSPGSIPGSVNQNFPWLHTVLAPYIKGPEVWEDPGDKGDDALWNQGIAAHSYNMYGSSYQFNNGLVWDWTNPLATQPSVMSLSNLRDPSQTPAAFDGEGFWHRSRNDSNASDPYLQGNTSDHYNVVFCDGHAKAVPADTLLLLGDLGGNPVPRGMLYVSPRQ